MGQIQNRLCRGCRNVYPVENDQTKYSQSVPWIDVTIKQLVKKRNELYLRARKSKDPDVKIHNLQAVQSIVQKVMRDAYWKYLSNIFTFENDSSDPDTPKPEKIKKVLVIYQMS